MQREHYDIQFAFTNQEGIWNNSVGHTPEYQLSTDTYINPFPPFPSPPFLPFLPRSDEADEAREVLALKVTYDAAVGEDIWYFYFNPETYAMVGYRFYHDEAANDGEYIVLEGMEIQNGLRIPKNRTWYTNADHTLLGTDYLVDLKVNEK